MNENYHFTVDFVFLGNTDTQRNMSKSLLMIQHGICY